MTRHPEPDLRDQDHVDHVHDSHLDQRLLQARITILHPRGARRNHDGSNDDRQQDEFFHAGSWSSTSARAWRIEPAVGPGKLGPMRRDFAFDSLNKQAIFRPG
jgi:hypothetical protein